MLYYNQGTVQLDGKRYFLAGLSSVGTLLPEHYIEFLQMSGAVERGSNHNLASRILAAYNQHSQHVLPSIRRVTYYLVNEEKFMQLRHNLEDPNTRILFVPKHLELVDNR